jgi:hypothetical protein
MFETFNVDNNSLLCSNPLYINQSFLFKLTFFINTIQNGKKDRKELQDQ